MNEQELEQEYIDEDMGEDYDEGYDGDEQYERMRDDECDKLHERIAEMYSDFVLCDTFGYYKGRAEKFVEHTIQNLLELTKTKIAVRGEMIDVTKIEKEKQSTLDFSKEQIDKAVQEGLVERSK